MKTIVLLYTGDTTLAASGGTEKVFANMATAFIKRGYKVIGITNDKPGTHAYFPLPQAMAWQTLGLHDFKLSLIGKLKREANRCLPFCVPPRMMYRAKLVAQKLDTLLQHENVVAIICYEFEAVLAANRVHVGKVAKIAMLHNAIGPLLGTMNKWQLAEENKMDVLQVLMPSYVKEAEKLVTTKVVYIPNVVEIPQETVPISRENKKQHVIITVGRLDAGQKRTHLLIQAFAKIAKDNKDWQVHIYGFADASQHDYDVYLQDLIKKQGLSEQVFLMGTTTDVKTKLQEADIFAFPSAYEGFPLAMTEAMAVALPVVAFKDSPGVDELLQDGETGILCSAGIESFAAGMEKLMQDAKLRHKIGLAGQKSLLQYSPEKVWNQWELLLKDLQS